MRIIQFIIPWSTLISTGLSQISNPSADLNVPQTYPIDSTFYNHFLANQAQLNQAILMQNNLLPANSRLPTQQAFPNFPQPNLRLSPNNVDLFNQQLQNFNQLPSQSFFDPLSIQTPLTDIKVPTVITPSFVVLQQNPSESYLGGIPSQSEHRNSRALTVKSFVGVEKSAESSTNSPSTTKKPEDSEQVRLIRKLLEETLAEQRNKEKSTTVSTTTTTQQPTTEKEEKSSLESVAELALLDRLNLNETEKKEIISRVEELLRAEIARKLLSEVSPPPPPLPPPHAEFPSTTSTISPSSTISSTTSSPSTTISTTSSPQSTTESTTITSPPTTTSQSIETTTSPQIEASPVITAEEVGASHEKTKLKSLALKQKKSTVVGGRSIVRPIELSESIDEPVSRVRVSTVQKEIREAQPRLPSRFIHNTKKDFDEDLDLIDRSGGERRPDTVADLIDRSGGERRPDTVADLIDRSGGERRPDTVAAASLLTSARRITYPNDYEEEETINHKNDFFQPITGAPLDLTDVYEDDEDGGLVDLDSTQRRRKQFRAIATPSPFSLRTTARPFHDETTTITPSSSSIPSEPINLETVTTPPYRNGRYGQHRATKFEVLASDYRSRLGEAGDLGHILKRLSQNAYIALIESDGGNKRTRHESRPRRRRNSMRL